MPVVDLKDTYDLARNYGLDITMPEVNFALSSAAQKQYKKISNGIYKEFQRNITSIMKDEQKIRGILIKLRKEKVTNNKYSLYRSSGADLFSKATQKRKRFMDNNLATVSPLLDDLCPETPWGLNSIIDEDLIRPQTAPGLPVDSQGGNEHTTDIRPQTAAPILDKASKVNETTGGVTEKHVEPVIPDANISQIDRLLKGLQRPKTSDDGLQSKIDITDCEDDVNIDGEVDSITERTRARKITINAGKFAQLQSGGKTLVTLKDKEGEFILKPLNVNYEPTEVEAVFFAKDPTKEKMALVRQKTNWSSSTVASDLKVNNRIAIQKSLMGKKAKKTTVAEIFNNARDRRTRHFRIVLKNPIIQSEDPSNKNDTPGVNNVRKQSLMRRYSKATVPQDHSQTTSKETFKPQENKAEQKPLKKILRNTSTPFDKPKRLQITINTPSDDTNQDKTSQGPRLFQKTRRRSTTSPTQANDVDDNVINSVKFHNSADHDLNSGLDRSQSSMSMRDEVQSHVSDHRMTEMIRRMVEGKGNNSSDVTAYRNAIHSRKNTKTKRKNHSGSDSVSNAGSSVFSVEPTRRPMSRMDIKTLIRDAMRRDEEYEDAMQVMRRRVALGGNIGGRRPNTVAGFR